MRFFIKLKQHGKNLGLKRIQSKQQLINTDEIIVLIQKSIQINSNEFIVYMYNDQNKLRIIKGWSIKHYGIKSGIQFQILLINVNKLNNLDNQNNFNYNIGEVLFNKKQIEQIREEDQQQGQKIMQISQLVYRKYDELLTIIQKNNAQEYLKKVRQGKQQLSSSQNQLYKKQLLAIQNELGTKGWAAIHCATFIGNSQIVSFLIQLGIDINMKSSDEWLPIQLAIKQKHSLIIDLLISQPNLNVNICTGQGLALNMAVQSGNKEIIAKLLMKEVNFQVKDYRGKTVYNLIGPNTDQQIFDLLNREKRRQSISNLNIQKNVMYHTLISSYRGQILCITTPPRKNKQYYLCINPYQSVIKIYEDKKYYPQYPKQILPLSLINKFKQLPKSQKSWYMKNDLFYLIVSTSKSKYVFGCLFQTTVSKWICAFQQCVQHFKKYLQSIKFIQRNDNIIVDKIQKSVQNNKQKNYQKNRQQLINIFGTQISERTTESPEKQKAITLKLERHSSQKKESNLDKNKDELKSPLSPLYVKQKQDSKSVEQRKDQKPIQKQSQNNQTKQSQLNQIKNGLKFIDFKILKVLGQGSFGTVYLAIDMRNPQKKKKFALKCFSKKKLVVNKQIRYTITQTNILKQLSYPFIVNLHFTFQTPNYVYLGLDYCPNKDLSQHLINEVIFPEKQAAFYAAQILLALQYLHEKNIIYRDLKPQNIMLDQKGHIKLVDFGLSKQGQDHRFVAKSFCGSPAYLSPEMLSKKGVSKQSDLYCLGAVLYQMLVGQPPFYSDDINTLYQNISKSKLTFPKSISDDAKSLLTGLLKRNPQQRLGYKGTSQIKQHQFFKDINWLNLIKKLVDAPTRQQIQPQYEDDSLAIQVPVQQIQNLHKDYDYTAQNNRINRFLNFSFVRYSNHQN